MARMETKRYNHGLVHYEGFVFVLGGLDEFGVPTDGFECFSFAYNEWKKLAELPKPMERPVAAALGEVVYFTDFSTRSIFTYSMVHNKMGRLPFISLEERTGKALIIKRSGTILVLSERKLIKIKGGKIKKSKKAYGTLNRNLNTPCTLVHDMVVFVSDCVPYSFSLKTGVYKRLD